MTLPPAKNFKEFEIWVEGFEFAIEGVTKASCMGRAYGVDFRDACNRFFRDNPKLQRSFQSDTLKYFGCRLYDNPHQARATFG